MVCLEHSGISLDNVVSEEEQDRRVLKFILAPTKGVSFMEQVRFYLKKDIIIARMDYVKYLIKDAINYFHKKQN